MTKNSKIPYLLLFLSLFVAFDLSADIHQGRDGQYYSDSKTVRFAPRLRESGPAQAKKIVLYVSSDGGETWKRYSESDDIEGTLIYEATRDGHYLFSTVAIDNLDQEESPPHGAHNAELEVVVDTTAPKIRVNKDLIDLEAKPKDVKNIYWKVSDANFVDHVHVAFFEPKSASWTTLARVKDIGQYTLEIPNFPWETFRVSLQAVDASGNMSSPIELNFSLGIRVVNPVSNISVPQTTRREVVDMLLSCDGLLEEEFSHYEVFYTADNGQSWLLAGSTKKGSMQWVVPRDGHFGFYSVAVNKLGTGEPLPRAGDLPKISCLVDTTAPKLQLESPQGGERYTHHRPLPVTWYGIENFAPEKPVKISYSADDGVTWLPLTDGPLTGSYFWNLSGFSGHLFRVKVSLEDEAGHLIEKVSNRFAIGPLNSEEKIQFEDLFEKANAFRVLGRWSEALQMYRDVLKYDVNHASTHNDMGVVFSQLKMWDKAIDSFKRASILDAENDEYLFNYAYALYTRQMPDLAEDVFLRVLEMNPNHTRTHWYLSEIRLLSRDVTGSKIHLKRILEINDSDNQLKPLAQKRLDLYP